MKKIWTTFALLFLTACLQTENSSTQDAGLYGVYGSADFIAARQIMAQNCNGCHTYGAMKESEFVANGLMTPGDPTSSKIYTRLIGSQGGTGAKNMPLSGGALSS